MSYPYLFSGDSNNPTTIERSSQMPDIRKRVRKAIITGAGGRQEIDKHFRIRIDQDIFKSISMSPQKTKTTGMGFDL